MENSISDLNALVGRVQELDFVEDAWIDDDCAYEGGLSIQIRIKDEYIEDICKEFGYNVEDWEDEDE